MTAAASEPASRKERSDSMKSEALLGVDDEAYVYRRMDSISQHHPHQHVLNKGFGGARPILSRHEGSELLTCRHLFTRTTVLLLLASLVSITLVAKISFDLSSVLNEDLFRSDPSLRSQAWTLLAITPVVCAAVNWFVQHMRQTTFWWEHTDEEDEEERRCFEFDPLSFCLMFIAALVLLRSVCKCALNAHAASWASYMMEVLIALIVLRLYFAVLDKVDSILKGMVADQEMINKIKPVQKMQNIVHKITRMGQEDKDFVYCFADANTVPAEVLSYVWWVYYIGGKIMGVVLILAVVVNATEVAGRVVLGGLVVSTAASGGLIFELSPNTISLLRMSLYKPFYVGDLITLNSTGAMDSPLTSITGFVENITIMYVIIRNFEMKQTWISHKVFSQMVIQNWTRRPTKTVLLNIAMSIRCPLPRIELLQAFGKRWMKHSPEIQQDNYQKCHITKTGNGYNLEVIFFPTIGISHRVIREKFLMALMAAAERLKIPFVPLQLMSHFQGQGAAGDFGASSSPPTATELDDLLPDPDHVELKEE